MKKEQEKMSCKSPKEAKGMKKETKPSKKEHKKGK